MAGTEIDMSDKPFDLFREGWRNLSGLRKFFYIEQILDFFLGGGGFHCSSHTGHKGTDRSLLTGHDALLLRQIARDLLHALSNRHDNT